METKTYTGLLSLHSWEEADDILYVSSLKDPLAEVLQDDIANKTVTARYWITDKEATKEQALVAFLKKLSGVADCDFGSAYSEITGYLWTDEECKIGGHDLIGELKSHVGKWLILEIDVHGAND
jgi:hypothetical protein